MSVPEWQQFDPSDLFPSEMDAVSDSLGILDTLGTALSAMATLIDGASNFIGGFTDLHGTAIQLVQDAIWAAVQQLFETGVYSTFHTPASQISVMTPEQWVYDLSYSLSDVSDTRRPILVDQSAYVGAVAICGTTNSYKELVEQFRAMFDLFRKRVAEQTQIDRWLNREDPWLVVEGVGRAPDWRSIKLGEVVPPIGDLARQLHAFGQTLAPALAGSDIYSAFAAMLSQKANTMSEFSALIVGLLASIQSMLDWEGAFVLQIYGQGDAAWVQNILRTAQGDLYDVKSANYTAGAMFLATGATTAPRDSLMDLFGLAKETTEFVSG